MRMSQMCLVSHTACLSPPITTTCSSDTCGFLFTFLQHLYPLFTRPICGCPEGGICLWRLLPPVCVRQGNMITLICGEYAHGRVPVSCILQLAVAVGGSGI